jgi:hypothetical protein
MAFQLPNDLVLQLERTDQGGLRTFVLFADAQSNEVRVEAVKPLAQPIAFVLTIPVDRSLPTLGLLADALGLVNTAALLLDQEMSLEAIGTVLGAIGTKVQIN